MEEGVASGFVQDPVQVSTVVHKNVGYFEANTAILETRAILNQSIDDSNERCLIKSIRFIDLRLAIHQYFNHFIIPTETSNQQRRLPILRRIQININHLVFQEQLRNLVLPSKLMHTYQSTHNR